MRSCAWGVMAALALAWAAAQPALAQDKDRPEFPIDVRNDPVRMPTAAGAEDPSGAPTKKAKEYTIRTSDDLEGIKPGAVYAWPDKTSSFKVIRPGLDKESLVVQQVAGTSDPYRPLVKLSGVGPDALNARQTTLFDYYRLGGFFLHPIAILGVVVILLAANCFWIYRRERQCPNSFVTKAQDLLQQGQIDEFGRLANSSAGLFPAVCRAMAERYDLSTPDDIKARCEVAAAQQINRLRLPVRMMNLIAAAAPLLGLLGTIVGMIIVFETVASVSDENIRRELGAGIRIKLFSTTMALCVAIPALFLYFFFNSRLSGIIAHCEVMADSFLHQIIILKRRNGQARSPAPTSAPVRAVSKPKPRAVEQYEDVAAEAPAETAPADEGEYVEEAAYEAPPPAVRPATRPAAQPRAAAPAQGPPRATAKPAPVNRPPTNA